jgi:hypothetical protein
MKNAIKTNAIQQVTKTLTGSQGGKVKIVAPVKPSLTQPEILGLVVDAGKAYVECKTHSANAEKALTLFNEKALALHKGGVKLVDGRSKCKTTALVKSAFLDSLGSLAPKTKQNYYELFFKIVNDGKAITKFKPEGATKPETAKGKTAKGSQSKPVEILDLLAKVYNHPKFKKTLSADAVIEIRDILTKAKKIK